jgi:hypothetical protein
VAIAEIIIDSLKRYFVSRSGREKDRNSSIFLNIQALEFGTAFAVCG